jgi:hypothetical protein
MRTGQVRTFCELFGLGDPAPVINGIWARIDTIVAERNEIAHGQQTPDEVGRRYTSQEIRGLVDLWEGDWLAFLNWVEGQASSRDFFRDKR